MTNQPDDRQKRMPRRPLRRAGQPFVADPAQSHYADSQTKSQKPVTSLSDAGTRGARGTRAGVPQKSKPRGSRGKRPGREEPLTEGFTREGPSREGPSAEGFTREGPSREGPSAEGFIREGPSRKSFPGEGAGISREAPRAGLYGKEKLFALILFALLIALLIVVGQYRRGLKPQADLQAGSLHSVQDQAEGRGQQDDQGQKEGQGQDQGQGNPGEDQEQPPNPGVVPGEDQAQAGKAPRGQTPSGPDGDTFTIAAVGDVLIHDALLNAGEREDGRYDFRPLFTHLAPIIAQADLAAFDMEGVFRGAPYAGYPSFSVPEDLADNLKEIGFDLAITANNHAMDFDVDAMMRTARVAKEAGLIPVGTRADFDDPTFFIQDINGIKVGISAFTYESPRQGADLSLRSFNNVPISVKNSQLIDSFYVSLDWPDFWEEDAARLEDRVQEMKKAGAEVLIFFMHWGTEYAGGRDQAQGYYAQVLANSGVDLVLGSGPHVIQEIRAVDAEEGNHTMLCFYSVGNCVSNQQYDTGNSEGRAQDGLIALASFKRGDDGKVALDRAGYVAHTVYKEYPEKGDRPYTKALAIPIEQGLKDPQAWQLTDQAIADLKTAQSRVKAIMDTNEPRGLPLQAYAGFFE